MLLLQAVEAGRVTRDRVEASATFVVAHGDIVPLRAVARQDLTTHRLRVRRRLRRGACAY